jgi:4-amino-4-deoxy-L-arabinose transferase-like glycosyltransferase
MVRTSRWVTPILDGVPYLEKPPLLHWTSLLLCRAAGSTTEGLLRLPAALFGFGALLVLVAFARRLGRERAGWMAAFLCATSAKYLEYSKIVLTDTCVAFVVGVSLFLFWRAWERRDRPGAGRRWFAFLAATAAAFYAKGLVGPALVWSGCGLFLLGRRQWKLVFALPSLWLLLLLLLLAPWAWALWRDGGLDNLRGVFWDNQLGRFFVFGTPEDHPELPIDPYFVHKEDVFYYLRTFPGAAAPWSLLFFAGLIAFFRGKSATDLRFFLRCALAGMLLLLHLSSAKVANYLIPAYPFIALAAALWLEDALPRPTLSGKTARILVLIPAIPLAAVALVAPLVLPVAFFIPHEGFSAAALLSPFLLVAIAAFSLLAFAFALSAVRRLAALWRSGPDGPLRAARRIPPAIALFLVLFAAAAVPVYDAHRSPRDFGRFLAAETAAGRRIYLAPMQEKHVGACLYYADADLPVLPLDHDTRWTLLRESATRPVGLVLTENIWKRNAPEVGLDVGFTPVRPPSNLNYASRRFLLLVPSTP